MSEAASNIEQLLAGLEPGDDGGVLRSVGDVEVQEAPAANAGVMEDGECFFALKTSQSTSHRKSEGVSMRTAVRATDNCGDMVLDLLRGAVTVFFEELPRLGEIFTLGWKFLLVSPWRIGIIRLGTKAWLSTCWRGNCRCHPSGDTCM